MERIVGQTIPRAVINNPTLDWNPFTNAVTPAPPEEIEADAAKSPAPADSTPEPNIRYDKLRGNFLAVRGADAYSPAAPTEIARAFELRAEMPEERVKALLTEILSSPLVARIAQDITRRLGRPLEPHDIWFNGFVPRAAIGEAELHARTRARYPTAEAFARDMPRLLRDLGFPDERARYLAARISAGASHCVSDRRADREGGPARDGVRADGEVRRRDAGSMDGARDRRAGERRSAPAGD